MTYLLDTSALLAHFRDEAGAKAVQVLFDTEAAELLVASVSVPEFARRLKELGMSHEESLHTLDQYLLALDKVVSIDELIARDAYEIICRTPERLPMIDALIAAAARSMQGQLVHRDSHMRCIPASMVAQLDLEMK